MPEPNTPLGGLVVPNTGDLPGVWADQAVNPNMLAIDGYGRGVQTVSLSSATAITLSAPSGSITPGAGPTQAQNAVIKLSGTLSGTSIITLPLPGYYIIDNGCTVATNYVQFRAVGTGNIIAAPPGEPRHAYCDGTNVKFVDMPHVGSYLDLFGASVPQWIAASAPTPYLLCDGTIYSTASFAALGALLGSTFGGNGASTFGVPDLQNRWRVPIGISTTRISSALFGSFNGAVLGAAGGVQSVALGQSNLPNYNLIVTDGGHSHGMVGTTGFVGTIGAGGPPYYVQPTGGTTSVATTSISVALNGGGQSFFVVNPAMVAGMTLIKT